MHGGFIAGLLYLTALVLGVHNKLATEWMYTVVQRMLEQMKLTLFTEVVVCAYTESII